MGAELRACGLFSDDAPSRAAATWERFRLRELYGDVPRLDAEVPAARKARAFRLRDVDWFDLILDDRLDRETLTVQRTRESLRAVPFYARRAERAKAEGDEWSYWRSVACYSYRYSDQEMAALLAACKRHEQQVRVHAPKALANMAGKALQCPPLEVLVTECRVRFSVNLISVPAAARYAGCERELCEILLRAIESGEEPHIYGFLDRVAFGVRTPHRAAAP